ncbi:MAG: alkaline phosphatase D family protein [Deltaproteobacteria bacterium]|nr:alkaline phosphatase D family protein [Deltaproteobacteria bacterium]
MIDDKKHGSRGAAPPLVRMVAVGRVTPVSVRIWARLETPCALRLELRSQTDTRLSGSFSPKLGQANTCAFTYPDDFPSESPLTPTTRYSFRLLTADEQLVGEGRFMTPARTPAEAPKKWTLAFLSCHQPFSDDGSVSEGPQNMLASADKILEARNVELVLFLGDQVYADAPECLSLFSKTDAEPDILSLTPAQIRSRYHERYRRAWSFPAWQRLHSRGATACLPDDHEVIDNWGSDKRHASPQWQKLGTAALDAAFDWQGSRSFSQPLRSGGSFHQSFRWGNAGIFMLDVRSHRHEAEDETQSQIVGNDQLEALEKFLEDSCDLPVLFFGVPVPMVHMPDWATSLAHAVSFRSNDLEDRWSNPSWVATRDQIVRRIDEHRRVHTHQRLVLLSGDIHAGWAVQLVDPKDDPKAGTSATGHPIIQLVSSAITNGDSGFVGVVSETLLQVSKMLTSKIAGLNVQHIDGLSNFNKNPFGGLNLGLVDIEKTSDGVSLRFSLVTHGDDDAKAEPKIVFDSGPL